MGSKNKVVVVDCGANIGASINYFKDHFKDKECLFYGFECDPLNYKILNIVFEGDENVILSDNGVWIEDKEMDMSLERWYRFTENGEVYCGAQTASSLLDNKINTPNFTTDYINKNFKYKVQAIDLKKWLLDNLSEENYNVLKVDVEGAEYHILPKLLESDKLISMIDEWKIEITSPGRFSRNHPNYDSLLSLARYKLGNKFVDWTLDLRQWTSIIREEILVEKTGKNFHNFCFEDSSYKG